MSAYLDLRPIDRVLVDEVFRRVTRVIRRALVAELRVYRRREEEDGKEFAFPASFVDTVEGIFCDLTLDDPHSPPLGIVELLEELEIAGFKVMKITQPVRKSAKTRKPRFRKLLSEVNDADRCK